MPPDTAAAAAADETVETPAEETAAPTSGEQETTAPAEEAPAVEETPAEEQPAEEKKDEPAEEKKEPPAGWKAVEAAKKEQLKIARARGELEQRETKIAEREQFFQNEVARLQQWAQGVQQKAARFERFERALEHGDIDTLEREFGLSYQTLSQRAVENLDPAGRVARLERELAERRQREEQERVTRAQVEETRRDASVLVQCVEQYAADFPDLVTWPPERVASEGIAERDAMKRAGRVPTYDAVLRTLQQRAKAERDYARQLEQRKSGQTRDAGSAGNADPKGASGSPTTTPALTGKTAGIRATPTPREKTDEEIDAECLAMLKPLARR